MQKQTELILKFTHIYYNSARRKEATDRAVDTAPKATGEKTAGLIPGRCKKSFSFPKRANQQWSPPIVLYSRGVKRTGSEANHSPPSSAHISTPAIMCVIVVSCHTPVLPGTSPEPMAIPIPQASSFTLQYIPYCVSFPSIAIFCTESTECFPGIASKFFYIIIIITIIRYGCLLSQAFSAWYFS